MASKDNQGLQAIIITLSILFLLSLVGLLLVNNARKTAAAKATDAESRATQANSDKAKFQAEATDYKQWMGYPETDSHDAIAQSFKDDMEKFGAAQAEAENRKYRPLLAAIFEENHKLVQNEANAKADVKKLKDDLTAVEAQKEEQVKKYKEQMDKIAADAAAEKNKYDDDRKKINEEKDDVKKQLTDKQTELDDATGNLQKQKAQADANAAKLEHSITKLREGLPEVDQFAQPADGEVTWVNQKNNNVWINIGSADGLRPQVTFSVAAAGLGDTEKAAKKGSIEVVRILDEHLAEAHITKDDPKNPLMVGDRIYSQVWDRGRKVGFAIAGFVDIDHDGKSDIDRLKNIITASNGRVDASPDESGKKQGELKVDTRYLVLGDYPSDVRQGAFRTSWNELKDEAKALGVQTIPLDEFLKVMGWQKDTRSISLSGRARPQDFPPQPLGSEQDMPRKPVEPTGAFKQRLPSTSY